MERYIKKLEERIEWQKEDLENCKKELLKKLSEDMSVEMLNRCAIKLSNQEKQYEESKSKLVMLYHIKQMEEEK